MGHVCGRSLGNENKCQQIRKKQFSKDDTISARLIEAPIWSHSHGTCDGQMSLVKQSMSNVRMVAFINEISFM